MITIRGKGVSAGVAAGPLYFHRRARGTFRRETVSDVEAEWRRFRDAQDQAVEQLTELAARARGEAGDEAALLFETHRAMAEDLDCDGAIRRAILESALNAEAAVADVGERFASLFAAMENQYMRARAADVRDVSDRLLAILTGTVQDGIDSDTPVILAADDLAPSETVQLDRSRILAFVTAGGSGTSHTAILARTMGIPAIVGAGELLDPAYAGREAIVDGETGVLVIEPDAEVRTAMLEKHAEQERRQERLGRLRGRENVTRDGRAVRICCNVDGADDVSAVLHNDGDGVGLLRSEFLYLSREELPDEDCQFEAYRAVLAGMGDRTVTIRTLDVGADKRAVHFGMPEEENPALGCRALRFCLERPDVFRTQLRALYRASAFGKLRILFPMVTGLWELREAKALCEEVRRELAAEGITCAEHVPLGAMIETPAAAVMSDALAKEADFFSCGTNDLAQYTLACDRRNSRLGLYFDPYHPAVLRLLKLTADNAHRAGIPVGICGDLAADLAMTETLLAIGIDEFSVPARSVLPLRQKVRETDVSLCRGRILDALADGWAEEGGV